MRDTTYIKCKEWAETAKLKMPTEVLKDTIAFKEASEELLKGKLAQLTTKITLQREIFYSTRA